MADKSYSTEVEQAVLGSMISSKESCVLASSSLEEYDFFLPEHKIIFNALRSVLAKDLDSDLTTAVEELKLAGALERVGGIEYLASLQDYAISSTNVEQYIKILKDKTLIRELIKFADTLEKDWEKNDVNDVDDFVNEQEEKFHAIVNGRQVGDFKSSETIVNELKYKMASMTKAKSGLTGCPSGYVDLDRCTQGFQRGDLIILAARPSVGKTALALNFAINAATKGHTVAMFSLEMTDEKLMARLVSNKSSVPSEKISSGNLGEKDFIKIDQAVRELSGAKLYIDDTAGIKISDIEAKARKLKSAHEDLSLIIVDYLQLISPAHRSNNDNRQNEVSEISRRLKALARDLNVAVISLSQLSRSVEKREDKHPMLSDLRESGSIEQDADVVMFIYRDDYYAKKDDKNSESSIVELSIAKHRNGPTKTIKLVFLKQIGKFSDYIGEKGEE